jgi:cyclopropane fatty-acyl-phospholipid synthase-like methyltransferase
MQETYVQMNQQMQESYQRALSHWRSELKEHLQRFGNAQEQFFADADSAMAVVSNKFLETANLLVEIERNRYGGSNGAN